MPSSDTRFADRFTAQTMPPTLFKLPDLAKSATSAAATATSTSHDGGGDLASSADQPDGRNHASAGSVLTPPPMRTIQTAAPMPTPQRAESFHAPITGAPVTSAPGSSAPGSGAHAPVAPEKPSELDASQETAREFSTPVSQEFSDQISTPTSTERSDSGSPSSFTDDANDPDAAPSAGEPAKLSRDDSPDPLETSADTKPEGIAGVLLANKAIVGLLICVISAAWWNGQSAPSSDENPESMASSSEYSPQIAATSSTGINSTAEDFSPQNGDADSYGVELGLPAEFKINQDSLQQSIAKNTAEPLEPTGPRNQTPLAGQATLSGQTNPYAVQPNNGVPVQTVASRTTNPLFDALTSMANDPSHGIAGPQTRPSQETRSASEGSLASQNLTPRDSGPSDQDFGQSASSSNSPSPSPSGQQTVPYRPSRTANGIDDWSQFLPPLKR